MKLYSQRDLDLAELAALADGSLDPQRRSLVQARIAGSRELTALLAEQERAFALVRSAAAEIEAPRAVRACIAARRRPRRIVLRGSLAAAALVAAVVAGVLGSERSTEQLHAELHSTGLVAHATGDATLTKTSSGWRIRLRTRGLPRLDGGGFYEAWLKNGDGALVPVGTFNEGTNVTLWAGVSPREFKTLTVTRERDDGNQASSGERVVAGTIAP